MKKWNWNFILKIVVIIWCIVFIFTLINFLLSNNKINKEYVTKSHFEEGFLVANKNKSEYLIDENQRRIIENIVAGEAGHEPFLGKMAVAQCILNAMKQDGLTASEVRTIYRYSGWASENFEINYPEDWAEVQQAVWCVFDNGEKVTEENILWFYAPKYSSGSWHNTQKFVVEISNHRFYAPWN